MKEKGLRANSDSARSKNRATIKDVAKKVGVSIATVSRVINNATTVSPATSEEVMNAIEALDYLPHTAARSLASRVPHCLRSVGLSVPDIADIGTIAGRWRS